MRTLANFVEIPIGSKGIIVVRGISSDEEADLLISVLQNWRQSKQDILIVTHPSGAFDIEFKLVEPEVLDELPKSDSNL